MWYNASLTNAAENFFYPSDVEIHHLETAQQLEFTDITVVSQGPLRAAVKAQVRYGQSLISVTVKSTLITPLAIKWPWIWVDFSWCHTGYDKSKFTFPLQLWHCSQLAPTPWNTEMWDHFRNSIKGSYSISPAVELPLDIWNPNATYETQFGYVQRPTHKNTTWDIAKVNAFLWRQ